MKLAEKVLATATYRLLIDLQIFPCFSFDDVLPSKPYLDIINERQSMVSWQTKLPKASRPPNLPEFSRSAILLPSATQRDTISPFEQQRRPGTASAPFTGLLSQRQTKLLCPSFPDIWQCMLACSSLRNRTALNCSRTEHMPSNVV